MDKVIGITIFLIMLITLLIVTVIVVMAMGNKGRKEEVNAQWSALAEMIQGEEKTIIQKFRSIGWTVWYSGSGLTGTYQGALVKATIVGPDDDGTDYFWSTCVRVNPAAAEWLILLKGHGLAGAFGLGEKNLQVHTKDASLKAWLEGAGALNYALQIPPVAEGKAQLYCQDGWVGILLKMNGRGDLPSPDLFRNLLQTAAGLAPFAVVKQH